MKPGWNMLGMVVIASILAASASAADAGASVAVDGLRGIVLAEPAGAAGTRALNLPQQIRKNR